MKVLAMTIHNRTPEIIRAVCAAFRFPGNLPDTIAVCYDRASKESVAAFRRECSEMKIGLRETFLHGPAGFRCPSAAWNAVFDLVDEDHVMCVSSDVVLGPHSIGYAFHMSSVLPEGIIVGKADHCGPSYYSTFAIDGKGGEVIVTSRTMTSAIFMNPLGFAWVLPMKHVRAIGGYSMDFMDGFCFEDNDFTLRMWRSGVDLAYVDDILALHMEHTRPHALDEEKVAINRKVFLEKYGDLKALDISKLNAYVWQNDKTGPGLALCAHKKEPGAANRLAAASRLYGHGEDWIAIPAKIVYEDGSEVPE